MIASETREALRERCRALEPACPWIERFAHAIESREEPIGCDPDRVGLDIAPVNTVRGLPNRARLKVFIPKRGEVVFWFYKPSAVPFSVDRFSYGGLLFRGASPDPSEIEAALGYLVSGLHPEKRPPGMRRAFPYDLPR